MGGMEIGSVPGIIRKSEEGELAMQTLGHAMFDTTRLLVTHGTTSILFPSMHFSWSIQSPNFPDHILM